nr:low molecular weight phosphotyrosine protein phosphatase [Clostridiales bacterium]
MKILFVCYGNICRSAMAEAMFRDIINKKGLQDEIMIDSAATSTEEIGDPMYPPAQKKLNEEKIP